MESWFSTFRRVVNLQIPAPSLWPWYTTAGQRTSLLRLIALAIEDNLALSPLLEQWANDERGVQKNRLRRLIRLLASGRPLADAVEEVPGVLRDEDALALRFDAQSGTRTAAIREMLESQLPPTNQAARVRGSFVYFCAFFFIGLLFVAFTQIKIVPVLNRIFVEFAVERPEVLRWSTQLAMGLLNFWWLVALVVIALAWSMFSTHRGRLVRQAVFGRLPFSQREMHGGDVLQMIGVAVSAGRPVPGALSTLARYHFDPVIRHQLLFIRNEVEQGADVWQSMTTVGLLTAPEVRLIKTAERVGNRAWVLKQLVLVKKRRRQRRLEEASELLLPALVLIMGGFVLFQALTVFQPLRQLMAGLL